VVAASFVALATPARALHRHPPDTRAPPVRGTNFSPRNAHHHRRPVDAQGVEPRADVPSRRAREWSGEAGPISFAACVHTAGCAQRRTFSTHTLPMLCIRVAAGHEFSKWHARPESSNRPSACSHRRCLETRVGDAGWVHLQMQAQWGTDLSEGGRDHDHHRRGVVAVVRAMALSATPQPKAPAVVKFTSAWSSTSRTQRMDWSG